MDGSQRTKQSELDYTNYRILLYGPVRGCAALDQGQREREWEQDQLNAPVLFVVAYNNASARVILRYTVGCLVEWQGIDLSQ